MEKLLIKNYQSPGDLVMLTAAVRDLHRAYPNKYITDVDTSCMEIWENNEFITSLNPNEIDKIIYAEYPLIHRSNTSPYHFIFGFAHNIADQLDIPHYDMTDFKGHIVISNLEKSWISQLEEVGIKDKFWIIMGGCKQDYTTKLYNPESYQKVIDHFKDKITFVQCGEKHHLHFPLNNVINLVGKTNLREFIRLIYHSIGVLCPITFAMHACAAIESKYGLLTRPCVVISGGRESEIWEKYNGHRYLSTNGALDCCNLGGCHKARVVKLNDGDEKDSNLCIYPVNINNNISVAKCMNMITPNDIIRNIEMYYDGGVLQYN